MNNYYISFGQSHVHWIAGKLFDKDCLCLIKAITHKEAREIAFREFGQKWGTSYTDDTVDFSYFPRGVIKL